MAKLFELGRRLLAWCTQHKALSAVVIAAILLVVPVHHVFALDLWNEFTQNPLDATALLLAGIIQNITALLGKVMLLLIEMIVVPILGYNGFYNSNITNLGWSLVRDVVNMFVVVVLLVIAVMTIVGYSAANWTQQLPRLFIAIVLVNFSKLICGVFIDMSQVIMFTFVNAIVSIAAGNFAAMLGLNTFGQFNADFLDKVNTEGTGIEAFMYLGAAYFNFVIYLAILSVMFLLAVAFIWRIIVLWILIIMSPLAFFMIGIKDIFHTAAGVFDTWKKKFVGALTFGPVLTFFLWLALAASSGSTLAQTEDFPMPDEPTDLGLPLEMFSLDNFLGMFLALAILIAGMQQASSMASSMGGFASTMISDKMGMGIAKGLARPFTTSKRLGKAALTGGKVGGAQLPGLASLTPGVTNRLGKAAGTVGTGVSKFGFNRVGNAISGAGAFAGGSVKDAAKEKRKVGDEMLKHQGDKEKDAARLGLAATSSAAAVAAGVGPKVLVDAFGKKLTQGENAFEGRTSKEQVAMRAKFLTDTTEQKAFKDALKAEGKNEQQVQDIFNETMASNLAYASSDEGKLALQLDDTQKERLQDVKFANMHLLKNDDERKKVFAESAGKGRANLGTVTADAIKHPDTRQFLKNLEVRSENGKSIKAWDDLASKGSATQRAAMVSTITAAEVKNKNTSVASVGALVRGGAVAMADADGENFTRRDAVRELVNSDDGDVLAGVTRGSASAALMDSGAYNSKEVLGDGHALLSQSDTATAQSESGQKIIERTAEMVSADALSARHFGSEIQDNVTPNLATFAVASGVTKSDVQKLRRVATEQRGTTEGNNADAALKVIGNAVQAEMRNPRQPNADYRKRLKDISDDMTVKNRYGYDSSGGGSGGDGGGGSAAGAAAAGAAGAAAGAAGARSRSTRRKGGGGDDTGGGTPPPSTPPPSTPPPSTPPPSTPPPSTPPPSTPPPSGSTPGAGPGSVPAAPASTAPAPAERKAVASRLQRLGGPRTATSAPDPDAATSIPVNRYGTGAVPDAESLSPSDGGSLERGGLNTSSSARARTSSGYEVPSNLFDPAIEKERRTQAIQGKIGDRVEEIAKLDKELTRKVSRNSFERSKTESARRQMQEQLDALRNAKDEIEREE